MKKALYSALMLVMVVVSLSACKKSDDGGSSGDNGTVATTPQACNIPGTPNTTGCNPSIYQQYENTFVPYVQTGTNGFCGCPMGYRPVMTTTYGISCAPSNFFMNAQFSYNMYSYNTVLNYAQNGHWTGIPQIPYSPANSGYVGACPSVAAAACDTRYTDSYGRNAQCGSGYCRATAGGSYFGLCSNQPGNESYARRRCYQQYRWGSLVTVCTTGGGYYGMDTYSDYGSGIPR